MVAEKKRKQSNVIARQTFYEIKEKGSTSLRKNCRNVI